MNPHDKPPKKPLNSRKISLILIGLVLVWIATGLIFGDSREVPDQRPAESGSDISKLLKIENREAQPYTRRISINGFTEANRTVVLKPEVEGKIIDLPVKKGEMVKEGEVIVRLDDRDRREKLDEAKARLEARRISYNASLELEKRGYRPRVSVAQSKADFELAKVELAQAQLNFDNTKVVAPFAGRLEELNVEEGDFVLAGFFGSIEGQAMARIVEDNPITVSGEVSEKDLPTVDKSEPVDVVLSNGRELTGTLTFLSQYANEDTRSFPVEVEIANPDHDIPVGMTATIRLSASEGLGYLVSSSVLALNDEGKVGVKLVDETNVVHFQPVEILANTEDGLWIGGLPERVRLVTQGQAFVNEGQKIEGAQ